MPTSNLWTLFYILDLDFVERNIPVSLYWNLIKTNLVFAVKFLNFGPAYSGDPNTGHPNTRNFQMPDFYKSGIQLLLPFEYHTFLVCYSFHSTNLQRDYPNAKLLVCYSDAGQIMSHLISGQLSTIWIPYQSDIRIFTVFNFRFNLLFVLCHNFGAHLFELVIWSCWFWDCTTAQD